MNLKRLDASHAEGLNTTASGNSSHAENNSVASGDYSHAEGYGNASFFFSHAEGYKTTASGKFSHAAGQGATAGHANTYCWCDGSAQFDTTSTNQFIVRATGTTGGVPGTGIVFNNGAANPVTSATSGTTTTWSYTPGNPANWTVVPTSIAQALDRIAAKISAV